MSTEHLQKRLAILATALLFAAALALTLLAARPFATAIEPEMARSVLVVVGGAEKAPMVRRAIAGDRAIPAGRLAPAGTLTWLVTEDAAAELERPD